MLMTSSKLDMATRRVGDGIQGNWDSNLEDSEYKVTFSIVKVGNCTTRV